MKKLLGSTLALALLFPYGQANAELLKNFKLGGQIDLQATSANNVTDFATRENAPAQGAGTTNNDAIGDVQTRIMLHMDWDLLDDVHAKVGVTKNDRTWGRTGGNPQYNANSQYLQNDCGVGGCGNGSGVLNMVVVDEANFKIDKLGGAVDATLGRQFYGESGDMVIYFGPSDKALWGMPTNPIDAARFDWSNDMLGVTGLAGVITGNAVGTTAPGTFRTDLKGLTAMLKGHENLNASVYLYQRTIHNAIMNGAGVGTNPSDTAPNGGLKNDNLWILGLKGKYKAAGAWLGAEFAKNFGDNRGGCDQAINGVCQDTGLLARDFNPDRRYTGWALKFDLGYKAEMGMGSLSPWGQFAYGSGMHNPRSNRNDGFQSISSDFRPGSIYGRFANPALGVGLGTALTNPALQSQVQGGAQLNSNSIGNRVVYGLGLKATPSALNKLTAGLAFWNYYLQTFATYPEYGRIDGGNKHIGAEIDLDLEWKHSENVSLGAGVGTFQPGGLITNANASLAPNGSNPTPPTAQPTNPATLAYFDVRVKF